MYTLRPAAIMACIFYKNPKAKVCWHDIVEIAERIKFPIYPDVDMNTIIDAVKASSFFEIDADGDIICTKYITEVDLYEFTERLPDSLKKEIYDAS